jgi:hypothetical protein
MGLGAPMLRRRVLRALLAGASAAARELRTREAQVAEPAASVQRAPRKRATFVYLVFLAELVCLGSAFFELDLFLPSGWVLSFRVAFGIALLAGGLIFFPGRLGARSLVLERLVPAAHAPPGRQRWRRLMLDLLIQLAALAMLIGAALELARSLTDSI